MVNCIIVDDEPLARRVIENHISRKPELLLLKSCTNALEAFDAISLSKIDLMFLDIKMPSLNGMDFLRTIRNPPSVIFTTAYSEFAAESYELDAVDYLLKPVTFERFEKSIQKFLKPTINDKANPGYTYFKVDGRLLKIEHSSLIYAQSIKDYILLHTTKGNFITHMTMKYLTDLLPAAIFRRVHRSYLIGINHMTSFSSTEIGIGEIVIPIGDRFKNEMMSLRPGG